MILVTGATGTIGKELVKQLSAGGHFTHACCHSADKSDELRMPDVEIWK